MKSLNQLVVVAIFAALACTGVHAQSVDMRVTVPFDFRAGDRLLPAGKYRVHGQTPVVTLSRVDGGGWQASSMLTMRLEGGDPQEARLEFNLYGSEYFLKAIWSPFTHDGCQLPQTAREKELVQRGSVPVKVAAIGGK